MIRAPACSVMTFTELPRVPAASSAHGEHGCGSLVITFHIAVPKAPVPPPRSGLLLSADPRLEARPGEGGVNSKKVLRQLTASWKRQDQ